MHVSWEQSIILFSGSDEEAQSLYKEIKHLITNHGPGEDGGQLNHFRLASGWIRQGLLL